MRRQERQCAECGASPADHYCEACGKFFCAPNGCNAGERQHHPTTHKPDLTTDAIVRTLRS